MSGGRRPVFLERQVYRRRRLMDGARILPVAGLVALLLPVLWAGSGEATTAREAIYLFGIWFLLILAAFLLSRPLRETQLREAQAAPRGGERESHHDAIGASITGPPEPDRASQSDPARNAGKGGAADGR